MLSPPHAIAVRPFQEACSKPPSSTWLQTNTCVDIRGLEYFYSFPHVIERVMRLAVIPIPFVRSYELLNLPHSHFQSTPFADVGFPRFT